MDENNLDINIGSNPSGIESGSKAASAAINKVVSEANGLDRAFRSLRSSIDPMFAAQDKYNSSLTQSARLLAAGRISEAEYASSVNAATEALGRQAAAQLRGTSVANEAASATKAAAAAKREAETAANAAIVASDRISSTARAVGEAELTLQTAREAKARIAVALQEAKDRQKAATDALQDIPTVNRNAQGRFISAESVAADRAAVAEEATMIAELAQLDATASAQKVRLAQRELTTRVGASRRAVEAEREASDASRAAASASAEAASIAEVANESLAQAQAVAAAAAVASAEEQAAANAIMAKAVQDKAAAAAEAAIAEEAEAKATADSAAASRAAEVEAVKLARATRQLAEADASRVASANRLKAALDPVFAAQQKYNQAISLANGLKESGHIDEATHLSAAAAAEKELQEALNVGTGARVSNRAATEGLVLVHEALSHRWTRMAGSAMILTQALAGQDVAAEALSAALSPVGLVFAAATAGIVAFGIAAYQGASQQAQLQRSLAVTGNYADTTAGQLEESAQRIATATNTSSHQATESLAILAGSGRVTGQTLNTMGEIVQRLALMTGEKSTEIAADMVKMADDPAAAMKRLNDQYHFLTPTQEEHIKDLIEEGNKTQAVADLAGAFNSALQSEQVQLHGLAGLAHEAAVGLGNLWQSMMNIGKAQEPMERLAEIRAKLAADHGGRGGNPLAEGTSRSGAHYSERADLMKEAAAIEKKLDDDKAAAHKTALNKEADDDEDALNKIEKTGRAQREELGRQEKAWRAAATALKNNPQATQKQREDAIYRLGPGANGMDAQLEKRLDRADIAPKGPKGPKGPGEVEEWAAQLKAKEDASKDFFADEQADEIKYWSEKLALTTNGSKEWVSIQSKLNPLLKAQAHQLYQDDLAALREKIEAAKGNLEEEKAAWDAYLTKIRTTMKASSKEYQDAVKEYKKAQQEMAEASNKKIAAAEKASERPIEAQANTEKTSNELKGGSVDYLHSEGAISDRKAAEEKRALLAQSIADEENTETAITADKMKALGIELAQQNLAPARAQEINAEIEELAETHEAKMTAIRNKGLVDMQKANQSVATAVQQKWLTTSDAITSSLESTFKEGMKSGFNFRAGIIQVAMAVENAWIDMAFKTLSNWLHSLIMHKAASTASAVADKGITVSGEAAKTAIVASAATARATAQTTAMATGLVAQRALALAQIPMYAGLAGAGGVASMAAAPFPLDLGAPAFGAAMAAVATAYGAMASAEGGQGEVPYDGQMTMLHKKEMVLPAVYANPLRNMLLNPQPANDVSGSAGKATGAPTSQSAGDSHFHYSPTINGGGKGMKDMLEEDGAYAKSWALEQKRRGAF